MIEKEKGINRELVSRFLAGDKDAFNVIFTKYYASLCFFASKILGDTIQSEDLVMDVLVNMLQKRAELKEIRNLSNFLYTAVRNASIDELRKQKKQIFVEGIVEATEFNINEVLEAEQVYAQLLKNIYEQIELLPPKCKLIFKMLFLEGQSTQQVAERLKLSVQSVRNQKTRAIDILKLKIDPNILYIILLQLVARDIHLH